MSIKLDPKIVGALIGAFSTGVIAGAAGGITLYKEHKAFREWIDSSVYPSLKKIVVDNGPTALRIVVIKVLEKNPKARDVFNKVVDAIEIGNVKLPRNLEKELFKMRDGLPSLLKDLEKELT